MAKPVADLRNKANLLAFIDALRQFGYVEGANLIIEYRSAQGFPERFEELAAEPAIVFAVLPAAAIYRASGLVLSRPAGNFPGSARTDVSVSRKPQKCRTRF